ncbi:MAG: hypothetical protein ACP5OA_07150 [Candidatus Woesearchaeota archaeon]
MEYDKKYLIFIVLLTGIILMTPQIVRILNHNEYMVNGEVYYNLRMYAQNVTHYDSLQGHNIQFNILNLITIDKEVGEILLKIMPIILGIITIFLSYLILRRQNISEKTSLAIILLLLISPIFIYIFMDYKIYSVIMFLNVLGAYLLAYDKLMFSSIVFAIIPLIDPFSGLITLTLLLTYMFSNHKHRTGSKIASIAIAASVILSFILNIYYGYTPKLMFRFSLQNLITDIGADIGVSFSIIILAIIGLLLLWENGWRNLLTYIILTLFMAASLFSDDIKIYMNFIIMIYAGFAFIYLNRRKWSINIIKKTTILLIICSIFFSSLVYMTNTIKSEPTPEYIDALKFIKSQSIPTEVILCSPNKGYLVEYYTERMVFVDDSTEYYDKNKYSQLELIASSRNLERTEDIFRKYNIKYVLVDDDFEPYLKEKEGLLFLIENSQKFTKIYQNERLTAWMYIGQESEQ